VTSSPAVQDAVRRAHRLAVRVHHAEGQIGAEVTRDQRTIRLDLTGDQAAGLIHTVCQRLEAERDIQGWDL
jgi:23S rRNA G2445 N2-methylase RlmL